MNTFLQRKINSTQVLNELIEAFGVIVDPPKVLTLVSARLAELLGCNPLIFIEKDQNDNFVLPDGNNSVQKDSTLINWLETNHSFFKAEEKSLIEYVKKELRLLKLEKQGYIFPLFAHNALIAMAVVEHKHFKVGETDFLETVFRLTALAYQNVQRLSRERQQLKQDFEQEKMASIGQMAASLAHEIKNPLTAIRSSLQFMEKQSEKADLKILCSSLIGEVDRIGSITNTLLGYARPRKLNFTTVEPEVLISKLQLLQQSELTSNNLEFVFTKNSSTKIEINADQSAFEQILLNLCLNSFDALNDRSDGKITVELYTESVDKLYLEWQDNGCGMTEEVVNRIFEPFFTSKKLGTGLGLAVVKQIVDQHGWQITVNSRIGIGTRFRIMINNFKIQTDNL